MKVAIYEESAPVEIPLTLRLKQGAGHGVTLIAVDPATGKPMSGGNLLTITERGTLVLQSSITNKLGLKLSPLGRLVIE